MTFMTALVTSCSLIVIAIGFILPVLGIVGSAAFIIWAVEIRAELRHEKECRKHTACENDKLRDKLYGSDSEKRKLARQIEDHVCKTRGKYKKRK